MSNRVPPYVPQLLKPQNNQYVYQCSQYFCANKAEKDQILYAAPIERIKHLPRHIDMTRKRKIIHATINTYKGMGKFDYRDLRKSERDELLDQITDILTTLKKKEDLKSFISRLLTPSEIVMLARRLQIAEFLVNGLTYDQIQRKIGAGISTIQSVDDWLEHAMRDYQDTRAQRRAAARAKQHMETLASKKINRQQATTVPGTLEHMIQHDSRMALIKLLLGG